jgi:hypothetical protein
MAKKQQDNSVELDQDILAGIKDLQQRKLILNKELAAIGELKIIYKNREAQAQQYYNVNTDLEKAIAKEIEEKHGRGQVDIDQGKFFPAE